MRARLFLFENLFDLFKKFFFRIFCLLKIPNSLGVHDRRDSSRAIPKTARLIDSDIGVERFVFTQVFDFSMKFFGTFAGAFAFFIGLTIYADKKMSFIHSVEDDSFLKKGQDMSWIHKGP